MIHQFTRDPSVGHHEPNSNGYSRQPHPPHRGPSWLALRDPVQLWPIITCESEFDGGSDTAQETTRGLTAFLAREASLGRGGQRVTGSPVAWSPDGPNAPACLRGGLSPGKVRRSTARSWPALRQVLAWSCRWGLSGRWRRALCSSKHSGGRRPETLASWATSAGPPQPEGRRRFWGFQGAFLPFLQRGCRAEWPVALRPGLW